MTFNEYQATVPAAYHYKQRSDAEIDALLQDLGKRLYALTLECENAGITLHTVARTDAERRLALTGDE